jgi:hypothetical protein
LQSIVKVTFVFTSWLGLNLLFGNLRLLVSNVVSYKNIYNEGFYFCLIVLCVFKHFPYLLVRVSPFCPFIYIFYFYFFGGVTVEEVEEEVTLHHDPLHSSASHDGVGDVLVASLYKIAQVSVEETT